MSDGRREQLKALSKNDLVRHILSLEAMAAEHLAVRAGGDDPRAVANAGLYDLNEDPMARGGVIFDTRNQIVVKGVDVASVDGFYDGARMGQMLSMVLEGRINQTDERVTVSTFFDADGAAAIITELEALAARLGADFEKLLADRRATLPLEAAPPPIRSPLAERIAEEVKRHREADGDEGIGASLRLAWWIDQQVTDGIDELMAAFKELSPFESGAALAMMSTLTMILARQLGFTEPEGERPS